MPDTKQALPVEAAVATRHQVELIDELGEVSFASLDSIIGGVIAGRSVGIKWMFVGDSITWGAGTSPFLRKSWADLSMQMVGGLVARYDSVNAGIPENTSSDVLDRMRDIMSYDFEASVLMIGTNDVGADVPLVDIVDNITAIIKRLRARGPVILCTICPWGYTSPTYDVDDARQVQIDGLNAWIRMFGPGLGCVIADAFSAIVDVSDGSNVSAWNSGDALHPGVKGHSLIAQVVAKAMLEVTAPVVPRPNGLILSNSVSVLTEDPLCDGGVTHPSGWGVLGATGSTASYQLIADVSGVLPRRVNTTTGEMEAGRWQEIDIDAVVDSTVTLSVEVDPDRWEVGDLLCICGQMQVDDISGTYWLDVALGDAGIDFNVVNQSAAGILGDMGRPYNTQTCPGIATLDMASYDYGPMVWPFTVPASTTALNLWLSIKTKAGTHRKFRVGHMGVKNLTTMGLEPFFEDWTNIPLRTWGL